MAIDESVNQLRGLKSIIDINQSGIDDSYMHSKTIIDANLMKFKNLKNVEIIDQFGVPWVLDHP